MSLDIPSIDVIRHWCGWGADDDFSAIRVLQFEAWLAEVRKEERERAVDIVDKQTFHYGKTHYAGIKCKVCDIQLAIEGEE